MSQSPHAALNAFGLFAAGVSESETPKAQVPRFDE